MIHFNFNSHKYTIYFYPCGIMARVKKEGEPLERDILFNEKTTLKQFLNKLEKIDFSAEKSLF